MYGYYTFLQSFRIYYQNKIHTLRKIFMAVPKKRTSKSKKNSRLSTWTNKAKLQAQKAISLAKSLLSESKKSFIYIPNKKETEYQSEN